MRLKFSLYPNPFRKKEHMATVQPQRISTLDDVLQDMADRSRRYSATELKGIFSLFLETVAYLLKDGHHIHLPFLKITTSISGKFMDENDRFDPKRHRVNVKVNPGKELSALGKEIKVQKVKPSRPNPWISSVRGFTQLGNGKVAAGRPAEIRGKHLKFDESHPEQGLFLIGVGHPDIRITEVHVNLSTRLLFQVPADVPEGSYQLMIRTTVGNSTELRQGYSHDAVQVHALAARA